MDPAAGVVIERAIAQTGRMRKMGLRWHGKEEAMQAGEEEEEEEEVPGERKIVTGVCADWAWRR